MKKVILPSLAWTAGLSLLIALILHLGGDFPDLRSYVQPRLGVGVLVFLIVSLGLFSVFDKAFLKKFFPWAAVLPILWMATFTWAYGFASLPEKKHLGDYYVLGGVAFGLPYVYLTITEKINQRLPKLRFLWELIAPFRLLHDNLPLHLYRLLHPLWRGNGHVRHDGRPFYPYEGNP